MSLREEVQALIRLQIGTTVLGDRAVLDTTQKSFGTQQEVNDMLLAYCGGLENAVLRLAEEIEAAAGAA
jgi:hypothetical protein